MSAKLQLESRGTEDLFWCLRRLFAPGQRLSCPCPICGEGSRAGEICHRCIGEDMKSRGAKPESVDLLLQLRAQEQEIATRRAETENYIAAQIERKAGDV